jgi:hypothetical protein
MNPSIPSTAQGLLELFQAELRGVTFPGADGPALQGAAQALADAEAAVEHAQTALDIARAARAGADDALRTLTQRALSYAKVYAEDLPELAAKLEALAPPRPGRKPKPDPAPEGTPPRRRGRPPKAQSANASLFAGEPSEPLGTGEAVG